MALKFANWFTTFFFGMCVGAFSVLTFIKMYQICFPNPATGTWFFP